MSNPKPVPQRQDPAAARVIKAFRLRPVTAQAILEYARAMGKSQGQMVDVMVSEYKPKGTP